MLGLVDRLRDWVSPPDGPGAAAASDAPAAAPEPTSRRDRAPTPGERQLAEAVAQKLLHGWLQNRHQTLMPLSVNLARLAADDLGRVVRFAAVAATAGGDDTAPARLSAWLAAAGADTETLAAYEAALAQPTALAPALAEIAGPERAGIAYVLALVAARGGGVGEAGTAFAEYVARRLGLSAAAQRSAQRRYGR